MRDPVRADRAPSTNDERDADASLQRELPVVQTPRLPAAAKGVERPALRRLYLFTLLSAADGSLVALAASGAFRDPTQAIVLGLSVVAGVGSWLAAMEAFGGRLDRNAWSKLAALGALALVATVASVLVGVSLGTAFRLHVLPKIAGLALAVLAIETAGLRVPKVRGASLALVVLGAGVVAEAAAQVVA